MFVQRTEIFFEFNLKVINQNITLINNIWYKAKVCLVYFEIINELLVLLFYSDSIQ